MKCVLVCAISLLVAYSGVSGLVKDVGCRDESGKIVDWFYLYKMPNTYEGDDEVEREKTINSGLRYVYMSSASPNHWTLSNYLINDTRSMPGMTLASAYGNYQQYKTLVMMYNDQPPVGSADYKTTGHTKGLVVANLAGGYWLVHSVPKYPPAFDDEGGYDYPKTGTIYGQSFLCITFNRDEMNKVGDQLRFNEPHFYSSRFPQGMESIYPKLQEALQMQTIENPPFYNVQTLKSRGNNNFISFSKAKLFKKELYEDLVAPYYQAGDFYAETWRKGTGNLDSDCSKPAKVYNIEELKFKAANITFHTTRDHSKWLVSDDHELICVGDINRQASQMKRGGGTVCQQNVIHAAYAKLINGVESCKKNGKSSETSEESNEYKVKLFKRT